MKYKSADATNRPESRIRSGLGWLFAGVGVGACIYIFYWAALWVLYGSYDTGWLIQTGQYILQRGIPSTDIFTWTNSGTQLVSYQWLFAVALALLFRTGTLWLVGLAGCLASSTLIFFALPRIWASKGIPTVLSLAVLSLCMTPHWFNLRPQICSSFLVLSFLLILEHCRSQSGKTRWLIALPLLMVLWVNIHLLWTWGLLFVGVYLACDAWRNKKLPVALTTALCACCVAVLVNPYGVGLLFYLKTFFDGSRYMKVWEMLPWYQTTEVPWTILFVPLAWGVFLKFRRNVPLEGFILSAIATTAALLIKRFEPMAVIVSWCYLGSALSAVQWSKLPRPWCDKPWHPLQQLAAAVVFAAAVWIIQFPSILSASMAYTENTFPLLCEIQKHVTRSDRLFNDATTGSYLIAMGGIPVFIDSRLDIYSKQFVEATSDCLDAREGWAEQLKSWGITQVAVRDDMVLNARLVSSPDWQLVLDDGLLSWWTRRSGDADAKLSQWHLADDQLAQDRLPQYMIQRTIEMRSAQYLQLARQNLLDHQPSQALAQVESGLKLMPQSRALNTEKELCSRLLKSGSTL